MSYLRFFALGLMSIMLVLPSISAKEEKRRSCDKTFDNPNWISANHDHCNTNSNPLAKKIGPHNVKKLKLDWVSQPDIANSPIGPIRFPAIKNAIVDQGVVYFNNLLTSLKAAKVSNGSPIWEFNAPQGPGAFTEPVIDGDFLYATAGFVSSTGVFSVQLFKLKKSDASIVWQTTVGDANTGEAVIASTTFIDDLVIVPTATTSEDDLAPIPSRIGTLNAFRRDTGAFVWQFVPDSGGGTTFESTPAYDTKRKLLFVGTSNATFPPAGKDTDALIAIDYRTGKKVWSHQFTKGDVLFSDNSANRISRTFNDLDVLASPNLFNTDEDGKGIDVVGINSKKGIYTTFDRSTGAIVWQQNILPGFSALLGNPSAAVAHGTIYTIASWTEKLLITPEIEVEIVKTADLSFINWSLDVLFNRTTTSIFALDVKNGKVKWRKDFLGDVIGSITEANHVLYTGTYDGRLLAFSAKDGKQLFQFQFPSTFTFCFLPPPACPTPFPNLPPTNLPLIPPILYGDITIAEGKIFVPVGFIDVRVPFLTSTTLGGLYVFSLNGKAELPKATVPKNVDPKALKQPCKPCSVKKLRM